MNYLNKEHNVYYYYNVQYLLGMMILIIIFYFIHSDETSGIGSSPSLSPSHIPPIDEDQNIEKIM